MRDETMSQIETDFVSRRGHGRPDTVNRTLEELLKAVPADYFWMFIYKHAPQRA